MRGKKKNLVLCSIGDTKVPPWLKNKFSKNFDICIICYGKNSRIKSKFKEVSDYFIENNDFKMPNYLIALKKFNFIEEYESFLFIDDDLIVSSSVLDCCFYRLKKYNLDACQPSTLINANSGWQGLYKQPGIIMQYTNFIECNFMCLSNALVKKLLKCWSIFHTGYGIDIILSCMTSNRNKIAVFHDICFFHPLRSKFNSSKVYTKEGMSKFETINNKIMDMYGVNFSTFKFKVYKTIKTEELFRNNYLKENLRLYFLKLFEFKAYVYRSLEFLRKLKI